MQYRCNPHFWPEVEPNSTFYREGDHAGKIQYFFTPAIVSRFPLHNRLGVTLGAGMEISTSQFPTYNHALIFSGRMPF